MSSKSKYRQNKDKGHPGQPGKGSYPYLSTSVQRCMEGMNKLYQNSQYAMWMLDHQQKTMQLMQHELEDQKVRQFIFDTSLNEGKDLAEVKSKVASMAEECKACEALEEFLTTLHMSSLKDLKDAAETPVEETA